MGLAGHLERLDVEGFCIAESVFTGDEVQAMIEVRERGIAADVKSSIKSRGKLYAARNLIDSIANIESYFCATPLMELPTEDLTAEFGLVRVLYFDKPSDRSWYLPWHKDLAIAVKDDTPI